MNSRPWSIAATTSPCSARPGGGCEGGKRLHGRRGALDVRRVDHDVREAIRGVQPLEPSGPARFLVGRPAAVGVLHREQQVRRRSQAIARDRGFDVRRQQQRRLQPLGGAVADRPSVRARRKRPAAARCVAVGVLAVRDVANDLVLIDVTRGAAQDLRAGRPRARSRRSPGP